MDIEPAGRGMEWTRTLFSSAVSVLAGISAAAAFGFVALGERLETGGLVSVAAASLMLFIYALVVLNLSQHMHSGFGYANAVTAVRAAITSYAGAVVMLAEGFGADDRLSWAVVLMAASALLLDGLDGYLARRFHQESPLGARFDMETDALLIMILSLAAVLLQKVGPWVLLIGLMRYIFVIAARVEPRLVGALRPSFRRKLVCVFQGVALCAIVSPFVSPLQSAAIAAAALAALAYSFAVDIVYLLRQERNA